MGLGSWAGRILICIPVHSLLFKLKSNLIPMQITRRIVFHAGHMLKDDTSKCFHPHGHEYVLECTIEGVVQQSGAENGMVMNFGTLKELMMTHVHDLFDHKFIVEISDPRCDAFLTAVGQDGVVISETPPTAENLITWIHRIIIGQLPSGIKIAKLRLQETHQCWVETCQSH